MTTLTSTLGWTAASDTSINVRVTATNIDGTSDPADETNTIKYLYIPQAAPGLTVTTTSDTAASISVNCLNGQNSGRFADTDTLSYIVSYKPTNGTTWTNLTAVSCSYDPDTSKSVTSPTLTAVTTYQFQATAINDIGTGPSTAVSDYQTITTYGKPSTPARPQLTQNTDKTVTAKFFIPFLTVNLFLYLYILNEINLILCLTI